MTGISTDYPINLLPESLKDFSVGKHLREAGYLGTAASVLSWDQNVYMPEKASGYRAEQLAYLASENHKRMTDPRLVEAVSELYAQRDKLTEDQAVNVSELKRQIERQIKLPAEFVERQAKTHSLTDTIWQKAKPKNDFAAVRNGLKEIIDLAREEADLVGYDTNPYNALLDYYEPGAKIEVILPQLMKLGEDLSAVIPDLGVRFPRESGKTYTYSRARQEKLCKKVAADMGFDFEGGRQDEAVHPFMTTLGPLDHRITTHYHTRDYLDTLLGTVHEAGHALYEMGLPAEQFGNALGSTVSLGIHESQSRFWENIVGRSRAFSEYLYSALEDIIPAEYARTSPDAIWRHLNSVTPSLIRIEADEVTYSLHVLIRTILEEELVSGSLTVDALPDAWNDLYAKYLGVSSKTYSEGVMQDTHWYCGLVGYFPTYVLGNVYGAAMAETMKNDIPDFDTKVASGDFSPLLMWLREKVHSQGMRYKAEALVERITGKPLSSEPFLNYIKGKFTE